MSGAGAAAPTGCYKCGRPGHWSRDCPSSSSANSDPNPNPKSSNFPNSSFSKPAGTFSQNSGAGKSAEKPKKLPKTRPKLTPELLLSDKGLGYILRHFPRNFKFRGRGHEVSDLKNLLRMYSEWHSQLLPYYPFDQFVHKVEQVGAGKRVRLCLRELRERVGNGGDPSTWKDPTTQQENPMDEDDPNNPEKSTQNPSSEAIDADDQQEAFLNEIFNQTVQEASEPRQSNAVENGKASFDDLVRDSLNQETEAQVSPERSAENQTRTATKTQMSEEQKARMEANKQKALERAMARKRTFYHQFTIRLSNPKRAQLENI
ncbi:hypothetical protein V2J09_005930 [Rumex salicifolius]